MTKTGISWTQGDDGSKGETWNPTIGCEHESEGCRNCYAEPQALRIKRMGASTLYDDVIELKGGKARWTRVVKFIAERLLLPLNWAKPRKVFVDSMSDMFHKDVTNEEIAAIFGIMAACGRHIFQVLTKRAARLPEWFAWLDAKVEERAKARGARLEWDDHAFICWEYACEALPRLKGSLHDSEFLDVAHTTAWPLPNVWLGVSVENQEAAEKRVPDLNRTPAVVRFLSCEPLLGLVELDRARCEICIDHGYGDGTEHLGLADDEATPWCKEHDHEAGYGHWLGAEGITWVIAGCESGPNARACDVEWLRALRDACKIQGVAFWLKQACGDDSGAITEGDDKSRLKARGVIEMPYLDGKPHRDFPEVEQIAS